MYYTRNGSAIYLTLEYYCAYHTQIQKGKLNNSQSIDCTDHLARLFKWLLYSVTVPALSTYIFFYMLFTPESRAKFTYSEYDHTNNSETWSFYNNHLK